jgi:hypothetical protein
MHDYFAGSTWSQTYGKKALPILVNLAENSKSTVSIRASTPFNQGDVRVELGA